MKLHCVAFVLVIIGALDWGLIGLGGLMGHNWSIIARLFGLWPVVAWTVYLLIGVSAIVLLMGHKKSCRECNPSGAI